MLGFFVCLFYSQITYFTVLCDREAENCFKSLLWVRERQNPQFVQLSALCTDTDFKPPLCVFLRVRLHTYTYLSGFCIPETYCFQHFIGSLSLRN